MDVNHTHRIMEILGLWQRLPRAEVAPLQEARLGETELIRPLARELAQRFPQRAQSMDAALAPYLRSVVYDLASGCVKLPHALPAAPIQGCCSAACGPSPTRADAAAVSVAEH
jgi:hypothetical protein